MKKIIGLCIAGLVVGGIILMIYSYTQNTSFIDPLADNAKKIVEKPLEKYSFPRLRETQFAPSTITVEESLKESTGFNSYLFTYTVGEKKVSGLLNVPAKEGTYPIIVMFRGFVPKEIFTTGEGTRRSGEVFAQNGYVTLAPDFLGFGKSENPSESSIEERFQTYTTALTLLGSLGQVNSALGKKGLNIRVDEEKVGIWGHSNGGHISLSVLAITGKEYPTVLWNPVTKPFPYSILYFTDEFDDNGKALRKVVADFEEDYDAELYSPSNYYEWIKAPLQLHQGVEDEAVPVRWSNQFVEIMRQQDTDITYFTYPGDDHNFAKGSWPTVVERSLQFYNAKLKL